MFVFLQGGVGSLLPQPGILFTESRCQSLRTPHVDTLNSTLKPSKCLGAEMILLLHGRGLTVLN